MANPETNPFEAPKSDDRESTKQVEHARQKFRAFHLGHLVGWILSYACLIAVGFSTGGFTVNNATMDLLISILIASTISTVFFFTGWNVIAIVLMGIAIGMQFAWRERGRFFQVFRVMFWALAWIVWNMIGLFHLSWACASC